MKTNPTLRFLLVLILATTSSLVATAQTNFFVDNFTNGSTINNTTPSPAPPTTNSTAYQQISAKGFVPNPPTIGANDLKFGIAASTSGSTEIQALFAAKAVSLNSVGDYIQLIVVFTNTSGLLTQSSQLGFGLYNSGQVQPVPGGLAGTANTGSSDHATGYAQNWQGYVGQLNYTGGNNQILSRLQQTGTANNNQDLVTSGSSSSSYRNPSAGTIGSSVTSALTLTAGQTYTEVLTIQLNGTASETITNLLYSGPNTNGTPIAQNGCVATNTTFITSAFDGLAIGWRATANTSATTMDVSSIQVVGQVSPVALPQITLQPVPVVVATNGACAFIINTVGPGVTYQWHRSNTNLNAGGNISVVNAADGSSSTLVISSASNNDLVSLPNGYYVTATDSAGSTNSVTNLLTLVAATNLFFSGNNNWDLNTSTPWDITDSGGGGYAFGFGDSVNFTDNGGGNVNLNGPFLSASSVTMSQNSGFLKWQSTGIFAGPGSLMVSGSALFTITNTMGNSFTGGTTISNSAANVRLGFLNGLGTGPITFAQAGGQMEIYQSGSAFSLPNDLVAADDFNLIIVATNTSYALILGGNVTGTKGKTLTFSHDPTIGSGVGASRIRVNTANVVCDGNILLNDSTFVWSPSGNDTYNGVIRGAGGFLLKAGTTILNNTNTYTGGTTLAAGVIGLGTNSTGSPTVTSGPIGTGPLLLQNDSTTTLTGSGTVYASGGPRIIANPIQCPFASNNVTLIVGGTNDVTFTGGFSMNGNDGLGAGTNHTVQVTNTGATTFSGAISDNGLTMGFIKNGSGALYLNGGNTYTGLTTDNTSNSTNSPGLLAGSGTILGPVFVQTNSSIGGGSATTIGTLHISNNLTNYGNVFIRVNKSLSPQSNDVISVSGVLTNFGTGLVIVTNVGVPTLVAGDRFVLFNNKALGGGSLMTVTGGLTSGLTWSNALAIDGSISVVTAGTDLAVTKSAPATVAPAANFSYTITATNQGPIAASSVVVTDTIPAGLTYVSNTGGGVNNAGVVTWALGTLNSATASSVTLTVTAPLYGSATNTASIGSATTDTNPGNNTSSQVITKVVPLTSQPLLTNSVSGTDLTLQWPLDHTGWWLQAQTNSTSTGISNNWVTVTSSSTTNKEVITLDPTQGTVFFRMVYTNTP